METFCSYKLEEAQSPNQRDLLPPAEDAAAEQPEKACLKSVYFFLHLMTSPYSNTYTMCPSKNALNHSWPIGADRASLKAGLHETGASLLGVIWAL